MRKDTKESQQIRSTHVRERIRQLALARGAHELSAGERRLIDDLLLLERWVLGDVGGTAMSLQCHQISKRLAQDFEAIEAELLPSAEVAKRRASREKGSRRRRRMAAHIRSL